MNALDKFENPDQLYIDKKYLETTKSGVAPWLPS